MVEYNKVMYFIVAALVYALLCFYTGSRTLRFLLVLSPALSTPVFWVVFVLFALTYILGFFFSASGFGRLMKMISGLWMGLFVYLLFYSVIFDLLTVTKILPRTPLTAGIMLVLVFITVFFALFNARILNKKYYDITIGKPQKGPPIKIALFSDIHIGGIVGARRIERIAKVINEQSVDVVLIAGDIFDNDMSAVRQDERIKNAFKSIKSRYGAFACLGNHDVDRDIENIVGFLAEAGIRTLRDETVLVGDRLFITGRLDPDPIGYLNRGRLSLSTLLKDINPKLPVIVLDHQPKNFDEALNAGADLQLSGHTHSGQLFPLNLFVKLFYKNAYGHKTFSRLHTIVTSGAGTWGPPMRTGSRSEVVFITMRFKNPLRGKAKSGQFE